MAKGGDVLFFNTAYYHVTKCCADVAKDMIFIGGEAVQPDCFVDLKLCCIGIECRSNTWIF